MKNIKIIVARDGGKIERHIIRLSANRNLSNAICAYGSALQASYGDIVGVSHQRGYCWKGHAAGRTPEFLARWIELPRASEDSETWAKL